MSVTEWALREFVEEMSVVLESRRENKGDGWQDCELPHLERKLREEVKEYFDEQQHGKKARETIDIANIAMMLWVRQRKLGHEAAMRRRANRGGI